MAGFDERWQETEASIRTRGIFMFNNDLLSDVSLVVRASSNEGGPKKSKMAIPAHKFVLSICSPVFFAMFCGELAERSGSVDLPDCEYEGVLEMLRYMYSGIAEINENNVMQVLYVAKKYILPFLADECFMFLQENLNAENVFCVLLHAQQYDEKDLVDECWEVIDRETEEAVKSEGFLTVERSLLEAVVKRDTLTIRVERVELFKAVDLWATKECEKQGLSADGNVKRKILGEDIIKAIRFPIMENKDIVSVVLGCKILTPEEVFDIMQYLNSVPSSPVFFSEKQWGGANLSCCRFGGTTEGIDSDHAWIYNSNEKDCIDLEVDKDLLLYGIRMFGSENSDYCVMIKIRKTLFPEVVSVTKSGTGTFSSVRIQTRILPVIHYYGFDVLFDSPVVLRKGFRYCVEARIEGPGSQHGFDGACEVRCHGVNFSFWDCGDGDDRGLTCVECGQFAEFLFRPKK